MHVSRPWPRLHCDYTTGKLSAASAKFGMVMRCILNHIDAVMERSFKPYCMTENCILYLGRLKGSEQGLKSPEVTSRRHIVYLCKVCRQGKGCVSSSSSTHRGTVGLLLCCSKCAWPQAECGRCLCALPEREKGMRCSELLMCNSKA